MLIQIVLYHRGVYYRYLYHAQSLKKSKTTCTTHIKNNNVIALFTHVLIVLKNTQMSQLFIGTLRIQSIYYNIIDIILYNLCYFEFR